MKNYKIDVSKIRSSIHRPTKIHIPKNQKQKKLNKNKILEELYK